MKIGLAYDLKSALGPLPGRTDDEAEEYDPPETIDALAATIEGLGHRAIRLGGGVEFLTQVMDTPVDLVFNIAEGRGTFRSREAQVPSVLEMLGIPYSGSDPLTLALCLDKPSAKRVALDAGVRTPAYVVVEGPQDINGPQALEGPRELEGMADGRLAYPLVVKPSFEGSSKGIHQNSRVESPSELAQALQALFRAYHQPALVEQFIPGTEVTVGVVGSAPPRVLAVMEVVPQTGLAEAFMYTLEVKRQWRDLVSYRCPPHLPESCLQEIEATALTLFRALGCRDVARFDFRVDSSYRVYFLEANPLPGLGSYSDVPIMASLTGWTYAQLIETILNSALARHGLLELHHAHRPGL